MGEGEQGKEERELVKFGTSAHGREAPGRVEQAVQGWEASLMGEGRLRCHARVRLMVESLRHSLRHLDSRGLRN